MSILRLTAVPVQVPYSRMPDMVMNMLVPIRHKADPFLRRFSLSRKLPELRQVLAQSPFRQMVTPGGFTMSAALSSCGDLGWTTDTSGYRYSSVDPRSQQPWPPMPDALRELAVLAAADAALDGGCVSGAAIPRQMLPTLTGLRGFAALMVLPVIAAGRVAWRSKRCAPSIQRDVPSKCMVPAPTMPGVSCSSKPARTKSAPTPLGP